MTKNIWKFYVISDQITENYNKRQRDTWFPIFSFPDDTLAVH